MSGIQDFFFDEFYRELEKVIEFIDRGTDKGSKSPILSGELQNIWYSYQSRELDAGPFISVDGGVQVSRFSYSKFIAVARACAITQIPNQERTLIKRVKIHYQEVSDNQDRILIPGYVRTIAEYQAAAQAVQNILDLDYTPIVVLDGALYFNRFPYTLNEYIQYPDLLVEFFESINVLINLARDNNFPLLGVIKDSTVFHLHMELLKRALIKAGHINFTKLIDEASTPLDLFYKLHLLETPEKGILESYLRQFHLCDTALVRICTDNEGYTNPLLLSPSNFIKRKDPLTFYDRLRSSLPHSLAEALIVSLRNFFQNPPIATIYWRPQPNARPFRLDVLSHIFGYNEPWILITDNTLIERAVDIRPLERLLDHLSYWYLNDVEYNLPLKQADTLARFDRNLYVTKYEPFIIKRLKQAGLDIKGTRRNLREMNT